MYIARITSSSVSVQSIINEEKTLSHINIIQDGKMGPNNPTRRNMNRVLRFMFSLMMSIISLSDNPEMFTKFLVMEGIREGIRDAARLVGLPGGNPTWRLIR